MKIEKLEISKIKPNPENPRIISQAKLDQLVKSLKEFPEMLELRPLVINKNNIVLGGNQRLKALEALGIKTVSVVRAENLTEAQQKEFIIKDNLSFGEWDLNSLGEHFDLDLIQDWGFDMPEEFKEEEPLEAVEDDFESEPIEQIKTDIKHGDIIQIGPHRLMCGDSTKVEDVERLMDGAKADMVFTDPPYNIASHSKNFAKDVSKSMNDLANSDWDKDFDIDSALDCINQIVADNCTIYIWTSHFLIQRIWDKLSEWCDFTGYCIWSKPNPMPSLSKRHWTWNTELCAYGSLGSKRVVNFPKDGHALSTWEVVKKSDGTHPTQKPIELISPIIKFSSNEKQIVADTFLGSGSTMVACHQLKRVCYGMELEPKYCQVIVDRMKKLDTEIKIAKV